MSKIIIPRRDHEVYFFPLPEGIKAKQLCSFAAEQLDKLHPAFSALTVFDLQRFVFNKTSWIMATVMERETLEDYKILNKGATFYTNTSIVVHGTDFLHGGIRSFDDEHIGFDAENNTPVSFPSGTVTSNACQEFSSQLKAIPLRHGIFVKKIPRWCIALAVPIAAVMLLTSSVFMFAPKSEGQILPLSVYAEMIPQAEYFTPVPATKYLPLPAEILAKVASDISDAGGKLMRWQYNEDTEPLMAIQLRGIDAQAVYQIFGQYDYAFLQDIQNISYTDGIPHITINANAARAEYTILAPALFPAQSLAISMIMDLAGLLQQNSISIVSETLPTAGNMFYTISYTANGRAFVRSLEIISDICGKYPLKVAKMDISISDDKHFFTAICSFAYSDESGQTESMPGNVINKIPVAFDYRTPAPPVMQTVFIKQETVTEQRFIGSIKAEGVGLVFYRDNSSGKMKMRENNE